MNKETNEDLINGKLYSDIEAISKALYPDNKHLRSSVPKVTTRSKSVVKSELLDPKLKSKESNDDPFRKDKKSLWSWKTLKAFTHVRHKRFNCCFSLRVHSVEGLPPSFNGVKLCVHWKRRDGELMTRPVMVAQGMAEFEEELTNTCSVYGSRNGPHHSAKYEAKHFLLYVAVFRAPEVDLGKHRVDLTRLLPLTLEELENEKSLGKWTTSYRLTGKGNGARLSVSFGYSVDGNSSAEPSRQNSISYVKPVQTSHQKDDHLRRTLPSRSHASSRSVEDIKDLHEVLPISRSELSHSVEVLYQKLDEEKIKLVDFKPEQIVDFMPVDPLGLKSHLPDGVQALSKDPVKSEEDISNDTDVAEKAVSEGDSLIKEFKTTEDTSDKELIMGDLESALKRLSNLVNDASDSQEESETSIHVNNSEVKSGYEGDWNGKGDCFGKKEMVMEELESAFLSELDLAKEESSSQGEVSENLSPDNYMEVKLEYKGARKEKSHSLDYATESVACDFLDMLGIEHSPFGLSSESEPESPRERLLRHFEKETLAEGCSLFNFNFDESESGFGKAPCGSEWGPTSEEIFETQNMTSKTRASMLEDLETEALMREWGINEKAFQSSPLNSPSGFGSSVNLLPAELPPLGEGLGPFVQTSNGGYLRSMNPELFSSAKSGGSLVMQVSSPVVVPAEMGSGIMDTLQHLASVGIERLSMQANKLMPLEDITGKTMQQIAWEASPSLEAPERQESEIDQSSFDGQRIHRKIPQDRRASKYESSSSANQKEPEYVSLEDLAPLAMDKIEALSIEGLRIQSGMSDQEAPSNISPKSIGEISALEGKRVNFGGSLGLEGTGGLQLLDIKDSSEDVDGLMGLSVTLDEWMKLDSGDIDDGDEISERTSKILAAHHASDLMRARKRGKGSRKGGLLGNNFTVALMVQLRDPLRNFEPVGTPMLALIQVERVFVPPKPKMYWTVSELRKSTEEEDESLPVIKQKEMKKEEEKNHEEDNISIPQFKITEVHVAGMKTDPQKTEPGKKKLWGSNGQQQSGSRWLLANGMGKKNNKHPLMKSKPATKSSPSSGDSLWSISSGNKRSGSSKKDAIVRNPNVIVPNETVKLLSGAGFL